MRRIPFGIQCLSSHFYTVLFLEGAGFFNHSNPPFLSLQRYNRLAEKSTESKDFTTKNASSLAVALVKFFDRKTIWELARATKFIQRKSKLCAVKFLTTLMFVHQQGKDLSLLDICGDFYTQHGLHVRKQSVQERFNDRAVAFMKSMLCKLMESQLDLAGKEGRLSFFNRVRIKDSTRFTLPAAYTQTYSGMGGALHNNESMISIQYEYDLLSGSTLDLRLTNGTRNDQRDAKENTHDIAENDLFIRDLGYSTTSYLKQIVVGKAYFLNRLGPQLNVYEVGRKGEEIDFSKCRKKIKKHNLPYLHYNVVVGKEALIPCRLIIYPVDQATYEKRVRKTTKQANGYGYQVSDNFKCRAQLNLYITNVPEENLPSQVVKKTYGLRWQIELFFKVWKTQARIDTVKGMKIHRFECQLIAKLLWLVIQWKIFRFAVKGVSDTHRGESCSIWKYFKHAYRINSMFRTILTKPQKLICMLLDVARIALTQFRLEERDRKASHHKALQVLA